MNAPMQRGRLSCIHTEKFLFQYSQHSFRAKQEKIKVQTVHIIYIIKFPVSSTIRLAAVQIHVFRIQTKSIFQDVSLVLRIIH